ncbi:hypothetical protein HDU98_009103 [Podochytrium sp. JEL0797]|nr:hypothetical protein HDU98_009103 [Podochytrium sp. JEL0797]
MDFLKQIHEWMSAPLWYGISGYTALIIVGQIAILMMRRFNKTKVAASHILVASVGEAKKLKALLDKEEDEASLKDKFAELARKHSVCITAKLGGKLGWIGKEEVEKEVAEYVFDKETKEGVVSGVIRTKKGFHLVMLTTKAEE